MSSSGEFYDRGEEQVVYFDPHSGDTHLITSLASQVLRNLSPTPTSFSDLEQRIYPGDEHARTFEDRENLKDTVFELEQCCLVERILL